MKLNLNTIIENLPEVKAPEKKLAFNTRIAWTGVILTLYFILSMVPLYGLNPSYESQFETISVLLAAQFGSLITLGIGPIVTASIILQLLVGADVIKLDMNTPAGKKKFQGMQKLFALVFIIFENGMYVASGALPPAVAGSALNVWVLILQLIFGGILLLFMDEIVSKWGIGSGISLFILAGVGREIFVGALSPMPSPINPTLPVGALLQSGALILQGIPQAALWPLIAVAATAVVFVISTFLQSMKVEIPLSHGRVRGFGIRWPISFVYTSNIPVILTAALIASLTFWGQMMFHAGLPILGTFETVPTGTGYREVPASGLVKYTTPPTLYDLSIHGFTPDNALSLFTFMGMMLVGSVIFSFLWMNIGGQDPKTVSGQILDMGLSIPGFRRDKRILERLLARYIKPLTVLGGLSVGSLAVLADILGALSRGTGILLAVMIVYQFYQQISHNYYNEMPPWLQKFFGSKNA